MALDPNAKDILGKYIQVARRVIYDPKHVKQLADMLDAPGGGELAARTVIEGINKIRPVPPELIPRLEAASYLILLDVVRAATGEEPDPKQMQQDLTKILGAGEQPSDKGMLAQMAEEPGDDSEVGDGPGNDNTPQHENAETAQVEQQEGAEEDTGPEDGEEGMLARMRAGGRA